MIVGQGQFSYELAEGWEQIPARWRHGDVVNVATDSRDRVYVFNRSEHPVIIYDRTGKFVTSWGEQVFTRPHGITIHNDVVYCADDTDHTCPDDPGADRADGSGSGQRDVDEPGECCGKRRNADQDWRLQRLPGCDRRVEPADQRQRHAAVLD